MQGLVFGRGMVRFEGRSTRPRRSTEALADPTCLMVNRNRGSGTRVVIDRLLKGSKAGQGFAVEPRSHNAVAAAVAQGRADWGLAIAPVAAELYGLGFSRRFGPSGTTSRSPKPGGTDRRIRASFRQRPGRGPTPFARKLAELGFQVEGERMMKKPWAGSSSAAAGAGGWDGRRPDLPFGPETMLLPGGPAAGRRRNGADRGRRRFRAG